MIGISDAAQAAVVTALRGDAGLAALVGVRVYDDVPDAALFPYISLGPEDWQPFEAACLDGAEGNMQIDVWSRSVGRVECKAIVERVAHILNTDDVLPVPGGGYRVTSLQVTMAQVMSDQAARSRHGVVQVQMTVERDI